MNASIERNRSAYVTLADAFSKIGIDQQAAFLNWGYAPVAGMPDEALDPASDTGSNAPFERLVSELIGPLRFDGQRFADIGCGRGGALEFIARHHRPLSFTGIDLSTDNITAARKLLGERRVRLQIADACNLPLGDKSQDVIFNLESSGAYPDMGAFLGHVYRTLAPGGVFLHGDLWPRQMVAPFRQIMEDMGFVCESFRDVTIQVCHARERMPPSLVDRLALQPDMGELRDYFAAPGSAMWNCLDQGEIVYLLTRWRKTGNGTSKPDLTRLNTRSRDIEACLVSGRDLTERRAKWFPFGAPRRTAQVNILAFPHAVAGASAFKGWRPAFPQNWQFSPVQLPGRESRIGEPPFTSLADAVEDILPLVVPYLDRPLVLAGWSLGSKLAFEFAHRIEKERHGVPQLVVTGACPGPHEKLPDIASFFGGNDIETRLRILGGTPQSVLNNMEMLGTLKSAMEGDIAMAAGYCSEAVIGAPILAISTSEDELVSQEAVESWRTRTSAGFDHVRLEGGHFLARDDGEKVAVTVRDAIERRLDITATAIGRGYNAA
ncbi:alpha/beta fold hydrolase [Rhizobium sp. FKY42]|uniref:alpha/beta fold hydrolase n=1 Tax=Rhizobium sp. FKY42 TaxID=2562310 RepID=UPI001484CD1A|nr:alpha/beta fold hydrolase [Rhizobium sp. FKY42]